MISSIVELPMVVDPTTLTTTSPMSGVLRDFLQIPAEGLSRVDKVGADVTEVSPNAAVHCYKITEHLCGGDRSYERTCVSFDRLNLSTLLEQTATAETSPWPVKLYPITTRAYHITAGQPAVPYKTYHHATGIKQVLSELVGVEPDDLYSIHEAIVSCMHGQIMRADTPHVLGALRDYLEVHGEKIKRLINPALATDNNRLVDLLTYDTSACQLRDASVAQLVDDFDETVQLPGVGRYDGFPYLIDAGGAISSTQLKTMLGLNYTHRTIPVTKPVEKNWLYELSDTAREIVYHLVHLISQCGAVPDRQDIAIFIQQLYFELFGHTRNLTLDITLGDDAIVTFTGIDGTTTKHIQLDLMTAVLTSNKFIL